MNDTCANCKWWNKKLPIVPTIPRKEDRDKWGTCEMGESGWPWPIYAETTAYACDYDGHKAWLLTEESHYCNQHQPK